jgi:hypothetical protein
MCSICEGQTYEELLRQTDRRINHFGFTMLGIGPGADQPSWIYTVGLTDRYRHPELAVLGEEPDVSFLLLGILAQRVIEGERFSAGEHIHVDEFCFHFEPVDARIWHGDLFNQWHWYYDWRGTGVPAMAALELVPGLPDSDGTDLTEVVPWLETA